MSGSTEPDGRPVKKHIASHLDRHGYDCDGVDGTHDSSQKQSPSDAKHGLRFSGPTSWFTTQVHARFGDFRGKVWDARRHRRNQMQHLDQAAAPDHIQELAGFAPFCSIERFKKVTGGDPLATVSFVVGPAFFVGSVLFVLGGIAQMFPGYIEGRWSTLQDDLLVNVPYLVGAVFFLAGAYASVVEVVNVDYHADMKAWREAEKPGPKPRLALWAEWRHVHTRHDFISFYGAIVQFLGAIVYVVGTVAELAEAHTAFSDRASRWLITYQFFAGGVAFVVGAYLLAVEAAHAWLPALLPPPPRCLKDVGRWIQFLNVFGSLLFFIGGSVGIHQKDAELSTRDDQFITAFGFLLGSVLFLVQSVLLYLEAVNPFW